MEDNMKLKLSTSVYTSMLEDENVINALNDNGIINIHADLTNIVLLSHEEQQARIPKLVKQVGLARDHGIVSDVLHAPSGWMWGPEMADEDERKRVVDRFVGLSAYVKEAGIPYVVVHANGSGYLPGSDKDVGIKRVRRTLEELRDKCKVKLLVENMPREELGNSSEEMLRILDGLGIDSVCDVNHIFKESIYSYMIALGDKIKALHISDNDGINERHRMPGTGVIDWAEVVRALKDIKYSGTLNFETHVKTVEDINETALVAHRLFGELL